MINDQLISYVKQQLERGVSEELIKNELLKVGWTEADFLEAIEKVKSQAQAETSVKTEDLTKKPEEATVQVLQEKEEPAVVVNLEEGGQLQTDSVELGKTEGDNKEKSNYEVKELVDVSALGAGEAELGEAKIDKEATPEGETKSLPENQVKEEAKSEQGQAKNLGASFGKAFPVMWGVLVLFALVGLGAGGFFYFKNNDLKSQSALLLSEKESLKTELNKLIKEKSDLEKQIQVLQENNKILEEQLSIFAVPPGTSNSEELPLTVRGTLKLTKDQFTLTTDKSIVIYIKNSKDAKVKAALEPFVEKVVELGGTHKAGSADFLVSSVNGEQIQ